MRRRDEGALHYEIGRLRQCAALARRLRHERLKDTGVDYDAERDRQALTQRYAKRSGLEPLLIAPTADILPALLDLQGRDYLDRRFN